MIYSMLRARSFAVPAHDLERADCALMRRSRNWRVRRILLYAPVSVRRNPIAFEQSPSDRDLKPTAALPPRGKSPTPQVRASHKVWHRRTLKDCAAWSSTLCDIRVVHHLLAATSCVVSVNAGFTTLELYVSVELI